MVTNARQNGKPVSYLPDGEIFFHADSCFSEFPQRAVCLHALELTSTDGDTVFSASLCPRVEGSMNQEIPDIGMAGQPDSEVEAALPEFRAQRARLIIGCDDAQGTTRPSPSGGSALHKMGMPERGNEEFEWRNRAFCQIPCIGPRIAYAHSIK